MKKIQHTITILCLLLFLPSCENDGGDSKINSQNGALPNIQKLNNSDTFINLSALENGKDINLSFSVDLAIGEISSMNIVAFYTKVNGTTTKATLVSNIVSFPTTVTLKPNDIYKAFSNINSPEDLAPGDKLTVSADITLKNGTLLKIINDNGTNNFSSNIATSDVYKVIQTYNVSCPSDLEGIYSSITSGASTDPDVKPNVSPVSNYPYTVEIKALGGGDYTITDAFGGLYILWYKDLYKLTTNRRGTFSDICNTLSGKFEDPFGSDVIITGTVNPDGTISMHWESGYGDYGDAVYTKK